MKTRFMLLLLMLFVVGTATAQTTDLFISEYVEGSGNNKALEIYNGTGDPIELSDYSLERYSNGATSGVTIALDSYVLVPGAAFVIANPSGEAALLAVADQLSSEINFNGDDTIVLMRNQSVIDCFGQIGFDPGSAWTCDGGSTVNATLRRIASFCMGDTNCHDSFDPCLTFDFFPIDSFDGLGSHTADCTSVSSEATVWGAVKATYR